MTRESISAANPVASSGATRTPLRPWVMLSRKPPASAATTARPDAIASSATRPHVSVLDGSTQMSALAYTSASFPRSRNPSCRTHGSWVRSRRVSGPSPATTKVARWPAPSCVAVHASMRTSMLFSGARRPTCRTTAVSSPPASQRRQPALRRPGLKCAVSTPRPHTIGFPIPRRLSSSATASPGVCVNTAGRWNQRSHFHTSGSSVPAA